MRWDHFISVITAALVLTACNAPTDQKQRSADGGEHVPIAQRVFSVEDAIMLQTDPAVEVRLLDVQNKYQVGVSGFASSADSSGTLIAIRYLVKNKSSHAVAAQSLRPELTLIDGKGVQYPADGNRTASFATEFALLDNDVRSGALVSPGMSVHQYVVFQVAADEFDPKTWKVVVGSKDGPQISLAKMALLDRIVTVSNVRSRL